MFAKIICLILALCSTTAVFASSGDTHLDIQWNGSSPVVSVPNADSSVGTDTASAFGMIFQKYKMVGIAILGICIITAIICLLWQITKLGMAGDNQMNRNAAIKGILVSGIAIAIFGSLATVVGIFWNAFA